MVGWFLCNMQGDESFLINLFVMLCPCEQHRRVTYINLLTSGRLNAYLADIDRQAQERLERLIEGMKQSQGITKQLKAENALEWTGRLNNIRACAMEIVNEEIIYT